MLFGVTLLAGGIMAIGLLLALEVRPRQGTAAARMLLDRDQTPPVHDPHAAPWGELVEYDVEFEKPDEYAAVPSGTNSPTRWFLGGSSKAQFERLALAAGLSSAQVADLLSPNRCVAASNGLWIVPSRELLFDLKPESRRAICGELAKFPENFNYAFPYCYRREALDRWFNHSGLSADTVELAKRFLYQRGQAVCLSDSIELMNRVPNAHERLRLQKTLSRQAGVVMKLRIRPESDIGALMAYWGRGYHVKDCRPLLESLARLPEGGNLDIVHLLPPFARRRLYSYPPPPRNPNDPIRDCHWTSMNFFLENPDDRFAEKDYVVAKLAEEYTQIARPCQLGDLVFWLDGDEVAVHSAVFIAHDIVFTKNGGNYMQPWTLMRLDDLLAVYPREEPLKMVCYRSKLH